MKFILKNEIKAVENAKQIHTAACAFDHHKSLEARSQINTLLSSKEGIMAAFGAGFAKGMLSESGRSTRPDIISLVKLFS